ncbi:MAG: copper resistance protein B [Alphaproteobacteria bacterium]|nr:MAG: copper resistance protein B [Alphaproteobacteria bacterium]
MIKRVPLVAFFMGAGLSGAFASDDLPASYQALLAGTGAQTHWQVSFDRFEVQSNEGDLSAVAEGDFWFGGDLNKLWIKMGGEFDLETHGGHEVDVEALYARAMTPFFDLQMGLAHDFTDGDDRSYGVLGVMGHAPYWIGVDAALYVSEGGDLSARFEVERDILLTQRLILQPRFETRWLAESLLADMLGAGVTGTELGLRLRYDVSRQFAPYVGVSAAWALGDTADLLRLSGENTQDTSLVVGLKFWF